MPGRDKVVNIYSPKLFTTEGTPEDHKKIAPSDRLYILEGRDEETGKWVKFVARKITNNLFLSVRETEIYIVENNPNVYKLNNIRDYRRKERLNFNEMKLPEVQDVVKFIKSSTNLYIEYVDHKQIKALRLSQDKIESVEAISENEIVIVYYEEKKNAEGFKVNIKIKEYRFRY